MGKTIANAPSATINTTEKDQWIDVVTDGLTEAQKDKLIEATTGGLTEAQKDTIIENIGADSRVLISSQNVSAGATIEFTGLDYTSYSYYIIELVDVTSSSNTYLTARTSIDNGASYLSGATDYYYTVINNGTAVYSDLEDNLMRIFDLYPTRGCFGEVSIRSLGPSEYTRLISNGDAKINIMASSAGRNASDLTNAIEFINAGGTMTGTFNLYGVR